jgi:hypothetical protein
MLVAPPPPHIVRFIDIYCSFMIDAYIYLYFYQFITYMQIRLSSPCPNIALSESLRNN